MRSKFAGSVPFRKTPATCFPPLEPEPDPGFVPCIQAPLNSLALITAEGTYSELTNTSINLHFTPAANVATVTPTPNLKTFVATVNNASFRAFTIGIRCADDGLGNHEWQTMQNGTIRFRDGTTMELTKPWQTDATVQAANNGRTWTITWDGQQGTSTQNATNNFTGMLLKLEELPAVPRSRPPAPMIPVV